MVTMMLVFLAYDIPHHILYHNEVLREYDMRDAVLTFISDNPS